jgi:hypothetical protein
MIKNKIKQMKRLQNPRIMNNDKINIENIEYQGEYENIITIENNPNKKSKEKKVKKILTKVMTTHERLTMNLFLS